MDNPCTYSETITTRQNLIILNGQIVSLRNIKNVKKCTETYSFDGRNKTTYSYNIDIFYHDNVTPVTLIYHSIEKRQTDFEDIVMCLGLGDSL